VYISTYAEPPGCFTYELELPPPPGDAALDQVVNRGSGVSFEELERVVAAHLSRAEPSAAPDPAT
jgi:hypothetical protein